MTAPASFLAGRVLPGLPRPVAEIVHFGAGAGAELEAYLDTGAARILMVEADPEAAAGLARAGAGRPGVETVRAAVSGDPRPRPFYRMNFAELSSLSPPGRLRELFPGLRVLAEDSVTPADPAALIGAADPGGDGSRLLVLETPGESLGILEALAAAALLHRFDVICLQEAREPLYEGAAPAEAVRDRLARAGFVPAFQPDPPDPERPWLSARLDRTALERQRRIAELTKARDAAQERIAALEADLAQARSRAEALEADLAAARDRAETLKAEAGEAAKTAAARQAERDAARQETAKLRADLAAAEAGDESRDHRIRQAREEMLKAEGQIRLLRDLLLNGPDP